MIVRQAIQRELNHQGQVFFVHNRVRGIRSLADYIPQAELDEAEPRAGGRRREHADLEERVDVGREEVHQQVVGVGRVDDVDAAFLGVDEGEVAGDDPVAKFRQLGTELPTPNVYRNAAGAPGYLYWQQRADTASAESARFAFRPSTSDCAASAEER